MFVTSSAFGQGLTFDFACIGLDAAPIMRNTPLADRCCTSSGQLVPNPPEDCRTGFTSAVPKAVDEALTWGDLAQDLLCDGPNPGPACVQCEGPNCNDGGGGDNGGDNGGGGSDDIVMEKDGTGGGGNPDSKLPDFSALTGNSSLGNGPGSGGVAGGGANGTAGMFGGGNSGRSNGSGAGAGGAGSGSTGLASAGSTIGANGTGGKDGSGAGNDEGAGPDAGGGYGSGSRGGAGAGSGSGGAGGLSSFASLFGGGGKDKGGAGGVGADGVGKDVKFDGDGSGEGEGTNAANDNGSITGSPNDAADYLKRIDVSASIFKIVSKRYVKETARKHVLPVE